MTTASRMLRASRAPAGAPRPLLVGEANPYGGDPEFALWPAPRGCAGERLCRKVMGLDEEEYLARFDRVNLCPSVWNAKQADREARRLQEGRGDGAVVVCLGAKVARAFGLPFLPFTTSARVVGRGLLAEGRTVRFVVLPHPSGLSRAWNAPGAYEMARTVLRAAGVL